ncbi:hypothetical protein HYR99_39410, partial [Candidatus Poribacteria bacterium]|nr:hypothetical protein [Candidatus Poribacteria bacterium]
RLYSELSDEHFPIDGVHFSAEELRRRVQRYEALTEIALAMMITGCYWGEEAHENLWTKCLERITNPPENRTGYLEWERLRLYPALLLLYGGGIASIAAGKYSTFSALLTKARIRIGDTEGPIVLSLYPGMVMDENVGRQLPGMERHYTPLSDHLYKVLREPLREFLPQDIHYQRCFDRFEYLFALVYADLDYDRRNGAWGPIGCFGWRNRHRPENTIMKEIELEAKAAGQDWLPLKAGLFDASVERFQVVKTAFDKEIEKLRCR